MRLILTIAMALFAGLVSADSRTVFVQCQFSDGDMPIYRFRFNDYRIERENKPLEWSRWDASNGSWKPIVEDSGYNSNKEKVMYELIASETGFQTAAHLYSPNPYFNDKEALYPRSNVLRVDMNKKEFGSHSVPSVKAAHYRVNRLTGKSVKSRLSLPSGINSDGVFKQSVTEQVIATGRCEATAAPSPPPRPVTKF